MRRALAGMYRRIRLGWRGGLNRYVYANGNPINFVDHNGLWSMTIGVFNHIGAQITFGKNTNGSGFMSFQFGFGSGGGFAYNPLGRQMGYRECQGNSWGIELGVYAQAAFRFGPIGASTVGARGRTFTATDSNEYKILFKPVVTLRDKIGGIMATSSFGGQITIFGGGEGSNECFCAF